MTSATVADLLKHEKRFRSDRIQMRRYDLDERARVDYRANLDVQFDNGLKKVARALKIRGRDSYEEISAISGLPVDVVAEL
ncbi:MAG: hypothetical protein IJU31_02790 [Synergistaceae bacterium]|nr:hypothetical protein [Synergistaceae bacterium]